MIVTELDLITSLLPDLTHCLAAESERIAAFGFLNVVLWHPRWLEAVIAALLPTALERDVICGCNTQVGPHTYVQSQFFSHKDCKPYVFKEQWMALSLPLEIPPFYVVWLPYWTHTITTAATFCEMKSLWESYLLGGGTEALSFAAILLRLHGSNILVRKAGLGCSIVRYCQLPPYPTGQWGRTG